MKWLDIFGSGLARWKSSPLKTHLKQQCTPVRAKKADTLSREPELANASEYRSAKPPMMETHFRGNCLFPRQNLSGQNALAKRTFGD
jgi:hypothetical protein